jgi:hypothetical protein
LRKQPRLRDELALMRNVLTFHTLTVSLALSCTQSCALAHDQLHGCSRAGAFRTFSSKRGERCHPHRPIDCRSLNLAGARQVADCATAEVREVSGRD